MIDCSLVSHLLDENRSRKHHYLPRYYLKGFTNKGGCFYVYDKKADKIFPTSPNSAFFENDLNTVTLPNGKQTDFLESLYTRMENQSWNSLDSVRNSTHTTIIKPLDKMHLFQFLLFLYWRLPSNIEHVDILSEKLFQDDSELDYFELLSITGNTVPKEIIESITNSPVFKKCARMIVPHAPFFKDKNWWSNIENWQFFYSGDEKNWFIVGDNPFITRGNSDHDPVNCLNEFIFPISGKILLVSLKRDLGREMFPPEFIMQYNIAIIERSQRFVACQNEDILTKWIEIYKHYVQFEKNDNIIMELFEILDETEGKQGEQQ